jgi:hypothetical protein
VAALYLAGASPRWQIEPDGALYLMLGENLAEGKGYTLFGEPHAFVPPGFPLFLAAMMRAGGGMYWLNLGLALATIAAVAAGLAWLRAAAPPAAVLPVGAAFAVANMLMFASQNVLSDVPFVLLTFIGFWAYLRALAGRSRYFWLGTAALWASCWVRVAGLALAGSAVVGLWFPPRKVSWRTVLAHSVLLATGLAATAVLFHHCFSGAQRTSLPQLTYVAGLARWRVLDRSPWEWLVWPLVNVYHSGSPLGRALSGQDMPHPVAWLLFAVPVLVGMGVSWTRGSRLGVVVALGYAGGILTLRPMIARYFLPLLPLLMLYLFEGVERLVRFVPAGRRLAPRVALGFLLVLSAMNLAKDCKAVYRAHDPSWPPKRALYCEAAAVLRQRAAPGERFLGGGEAGNILSRLSGVPYRDLYPVFGERRPDAGEIVELLRRIDVRWVVVWPEQTSRPYEEVLSQAAPRRADFELVLENRLIAVYRIRSN